MGAVARKAGGTARFVGSREVYVVPTLTDVPRPSVLELQRLRRSYEETGGEIIEEPGELDELLGSVGSGGCESKGYCI